MKAVILCGGRGTRLGEHGRNVPKALIKIGGKPIIWHLLSIFSHYGVNDFVLCLGYLGEEIKGYFAGNTNGWNIEFVETGLDTNTGGRLKRVEQYLRDSDQFFVTYGDGLAGVDISELMSFHNGHGKVATVTTVHPFSPFGLVDLDSDGTIKRFREKPLLDDWINGGFFVFDHGIFNHLTDDCVLEREPFETLSGKGEMMAYRHEGFWKCMDTYKDNLEFEDLWNNGAPWKVW
ncbi:MAG: sugar phosphate nucleotidyltransferase [Pyrinomonadaceae bacterium]